MYMHSEDFEYFSDPKSTQLTQQKIEHVLPYKCDLYVRCHQILSNLRISPSVQQLCEFFFLFNGLNFTLASIF